MTIIITTTWDQTTRYKTGYMASSKMAFPACHLGMMDAVTGYIVVTKGRITETV